MTSAASGAITTSWIGAPGARAAASQSAMNVGPLSSTSLGWKNSGRLWPPSARPHSGDGASQSKAWGTSAATITRSPDVPHAGAVHLGVDALGRDRVRGEVAVERGLGAVHRERRALHFHVGGVE